MFQGTDLYTINKRAYSSLTKDHSIEMFQILTLKSMSAVNRKLAFHVLHQKYAKAPVLKVRFFRPLPVVHIAPL